MALALVRDLREFRGPVSAEELEQFETDVLAGFVLARASAGLADGTIRGDVGHLEQMRSWFGQPLWEMEPSDADVYFGKVLPGSPSGIRLARAQALTTYFLFLELRHKVEIHRMTGRVVECPIDEMNRPRGSKDAATAGRPSPRYWPATPKPSARCRSVPCSNHSPTSARSGPTNSSPRWESPTAAASKVWAPSSGHTFSIGSHPRADQRRPATSSRTQRSGPGSERAPDAGRGSGAHPHHCRGDVHVSPGTTGFPRESHADAPAVRSTGTPFDLARCSSWRRCRHPAPRI